MNALRIGFVITTLAGAMYAAAGLFTSLTEFGVGLAVACAALVGHGCVDFCESRRDDRIYRTRQQVWDRRDR